MRKALIGLILAATAMTPVAAWAQDGRGGRAERIQERNEQRAQARSERQAQRSEPRAQRQEAPRQRQVQAQPAPQVRARNSRGERNLARGGFGARPQGDVAVQQQVVQRERRGDRFRNRGGDGVRDSAYPQAWQGNPNDPRRRHYEELERRNQYRYGTREQRQDVRRERRDDRGDDRRDWRNDRRDDRRDWRNDRRDDRRDWRNDRRGDRRDWSRNWNRSSWRSDRRYDWRNWRYSNRNLFRLSRYYSPYRNHHYSRFSIGFFLEPLFYSQRYWIGDPYQYRLPYAPPGTQWVRYYNDVLLVDTYSGEVIDVIYDFFW